LEEVEEELEVDEELEVEEEVDVGVGITTDSLDF
jgi:hypothetical protein